MSHICTRFYADLLPPTKSGFLLLLNSYLKCFFITIGFFSSQEDPIVGSLLIPNVGFFFSSNSVSKCLPFFSFLGTQNASLIATLMVPTHSRRRTSFVHSSHIQNFDPPPKNFFANFFYTYVSTLHLIPNHWRPSFLPTLHFYRLFFINSVKLYS